MPGAGAALVLYHRCSRGKFSRTVSDLTGFLPRFLPSDARPAVVLARGPGCRNDIRGRVAAPGRGTGPIISECRGSAQSKACKRQDVEGPTFKPEPRPPAPGPFFVSRVSM